MNIKTKHAVHPSSKHFKLLDMSANLETGQTRRTKCIRIFFFHTENKHLSTPGLSNKIFGSFH